MYCHINSDLNKISVSFGSASPVRLTWLNTTNPCLWTPSYPKGLDEITEPIVVTDHPCLLYQYFYAGFGRDYGKWFIKMFWTFIASKRKWFSCSNGDRPLCLQNCSFAFHMKPIIIYAVTYFVPCENISHEWKSISYSSPSRLQSSERCKSIR
jgi:hypothetical protein